MPAFTSWQQSFTSHYTLAGIHYPSRQGEEAELVKVAVRYRVKKIEQRKKKHQEIGTTYFYLLHQIIANLSPLQPRINYSCVLTFFWQWRRSTVFLKGPHASLKCKCRRLLWLTVPRMRLLNKNLTFSSWQFSRNFTGWRIKCARS